MAIVKKIENYQDMSDTPIKKTIGSKPIQQSSWETRLPEKNENGELLHHYGLTNKGQKWVSQDYLNKVNNRQHCWQCKNLDKRGKCNTAIKGTLGENFQNDKYYPDPMVDRRCVGFKLQPSARPPYSFDEQEGFERKKFVETVETAREAGLVQSDLAWIHSVIKEIAIAEGCDQSKLTDEILSDYKQHFNVAHDGHDIPHQKNNKARQCANSWLLKEKERRLELLVKKGYDIDGLGF